jgi:hypothetical protein
MNKKVTLNVVLIFLCALIYAILRYNVFKGILWIHLPLYIFNKTFALTGIILLSFAAIIGKRKKDQLSDTRSKQYGWMGFQFILIHVLCSFVLLNENYFGKFYDQGKLNLIGELSMLFGIIAFIVLIIHNYRDLISNVNPEEYILPIKNNSLRIMSRIFVAVHLITMGLEGWITPATWPGYLLPISLISFLILSIGFFYGLTANEERGN